MKIKKRNRKFKVGRKKNIILKDVGSIKLNDNENITFIDTNLREYDVCKKNWGYYATPSLNKRVKKYGYIAGLVYNKKFKTFFIHLVDTRKKKIFKSYLKKENMKLICWLNSKNLERIKVSFK
ncbi:hypothetical protein [Candidatus Pelagibacter communis]|uniref:hypothetical protein n=1 Tax=Pelagibacter ubique TaxID=198252 RepID=UPI00094CA474|nr:hypothetical protein [Candidatus Pelagibacter ubique]